MWEPEQYLRYAEHRLRPAVDLLARVGLISPDRIVDLGCGVGNVTQMIATRWPNAELTGVDSSAEMLARARELPDSIDWVQADIATWSPKTPLDLVFSNSVLHFVDEHKHLLLKLLEFVTPGGVLAIQMPRNFGEPSHTLMYDTARAGPWRKQLETPFATGTRSRAGSVPRHLGPPRVVPRHLGNGVPASAGGRRPGRRVDRRYVGETPTRSPGC